MKDELSQDKLPLHPANFYSEQAIELLTDTQVSSIDCRGKTVTLGNGANHSFDALLIATGAEPVKLPAAGAELPHVCYLRSWRDCRTILAKAANAANVVVVGASFIAMEVAASLAQRHLKVQVVAPEQIPMAGILGPQLGLFLRHLHESKGTIFHLGQRVAAVEPGAVILQNGTRLPADLVIVGIGVQPRIELAEAAGIKTSKGILVNSFLETSVPSIFAAGDIAQWPDPFTGAPIRVEHWAVAEHQGQTAAQNILGRKTPFAAIPFFWTRQFDFTVHYNGHAEEWDQIVIDGSLEEYNCRLEFKLNNKTIAIATVGRDLESLELEAALEDRLTE